MELLSITEIATWQIRSLSLRNGASPSWVAEIPSLQRGAVWKPAQVELLWDSLFRGFPIGALVLTEKLETQVSRPGKHAVGNDLAWPEASIPKLHILDGQQRSNAIALGFLDPFEGSHKPSTILWIDLFPSDDFFRADNTRQYLFRVTTRAHPWGYEVDDKSDRLSAHAMRESMKWKEDGLHEITHIRPHPTELWPLRASVPIPVAWLFEAAREMDPEAMRIRLVERCQKSAMPWAVKAATELSETENSEHWCKIVEGVRRAFQVRVPPLFVGQEALVLQTRHEAAETEGQNISNVEHLFQRLNNAGTQISPEELQYSMIKAYWPGIEQTISAVQPVPMRPSRLALLGVRASLAPIFTSEGQLPAILSISEVRRMAVDKGRWDRRALARRFFGLEGTHEEAHLVRITRQVDQWLLFRSGSTNDFGLPPALRTAIAHHSPEIYLLLMTLAGRIFREGSDPDSFRKTIVALSTALHWFSLDQHKVVGDVFAALSKFERLAPASFSGILASSAQHGMLSLPSADKMKSDFLPEPQIGDVKISNWLWIKLVAEPSGDDEAKKQSLMSEVWPITEAILDTKELLLYAQREFMSLKFSDFDQGDEEAWEDHNRPWDYDHLAPDEVRHIRNEREHIDFFNRWHSTIGNFHVLPFAENRSRGATPANQFFSGRTDQELSMMLVERESLSVFSINKHQLKQDPNAVLAFALATRSRMLNIYKDWYGSLDVGSLFEGCVPMP